MATSTQVTPVRPTSAIARFQAFLRDVRSESRKVTWPSREQLRESTIVVIVTVFIISGLIAIIDRVIGVIVTALMRMFV